MAQEDFSNGLRVSVSVRHGRLPRPGAERHPWSWEDVLDAPPPSRKRAPRESAFVVRIGVDEEHPDPEARIGFATVVTVRGNGRGRPVVGVDDGVYAEPRILSRVIHLEHAVAQRVTRGSRVGLQLVTRGSDTLSDRVGGRTGAVLRNGANAVVDSIRWAGHAVHDVLHAAVEAPDRFWAGANAVDAHFAHPRERRALIRGLVDPASLTREGKAAALFLSVVGLAALALFATLGIFFMQPELAVAWRAVVSYFALGLGSTLVFPFFTEFRLKEVADLVGAPAAILTVTLGMTVGGWMVLFLGDEIHHSLRRSARRGSPLEGVLDRAEAFARRHGFWTAFLILAIPLGPDTPVFYILATVGTPARQYLFGTFLGLLARFSMWHYVPVIYHDHFSGQFVGP